MNYNGEEYFYLRNLQQDIIALIDITGTIKVNYEYDAWGNIISITDTSGVNIGEINPYRYRGYRYDEETGFYYLNSRYYNPEIGRFIKADGLIGETGDILGHNLYAYCQNNPVMYEDPSGYFQSETGVDPFSNGGWGGIPTEIGDVALALIITQSANMLLSQVDWDELYNGVSDSIKEIANATETAYSKKIQSGYNIYQISDVNGQIFYVGITRNKTARERAHHARFGQHIKVDYVAENISLSQAKVIETGLISHYTLSNLENKRLSISNLRYSTELLLNKVESDLLLLLGK